MRTLALLLATALVVACQPQRHETPGDSVATVPTATMPCQLKGDQPMRLGRFAADSLGVAYLCVAPAPADGGGDTVLRQRLIDEHIALGPVPFPGAIWLRLVKP